MYKVMLIDDEPVILKGIRNIINWEEHGVEIAAEMTDGREAMQLFEKIKIDLLLTDIKMPDISGLEILRTVRRNYPSTKCIILSGFNDFEYVKEAVRLGIENYLLKPVNQDELSSTITNAVEKIEIELHEKMKIGDYSKILKENILNRWMTNNISPAELLQRASFLETEIECNNFTVALIRILDPHTAERQENDRGRLVFAASNICADILCTNMLRSYKGCSVFTDLEGDVTALFYGENIRKDEVAKLLAQCLKNIIDSLAVDVFICVGSSEVSLENVHKSYSKAKLLMEYRLISGGNRLVDYEAIEASKAGKRDIMDVDYGRLGQALESQNLMAAIGFIEELYRNIGNIDGIAPETVYDFTIEMLYNIFTFLHFKKVSLADICGDSGSIYNQIRSIKSIDGICSWISEIVKRAIEAAKNEGNNINPIIQRTVGYIQDNYQKEISLKTLAADFKMNAAYLGRLFKTEKGEMLSGYLNRVRIEKAKELLLNSSISTHEIAGLVGYPNANHFYNIFKNATGMYPAKFRRTWSV